jgi:hypothetical protein
MRIRGEHLPQQRASLAASTCQYAAPTELTPIWVIDGYKDFAPTELQTRQELETRHSEFQNLVGVDCSVGGCLPRKRGRSIRT